MNDESSMNQRKRRCAKVCFCAEHDALTPYLEKGQARMFIELVRRQVEQGRQGTRASLARSDQTVETFRQNKGQLRLQLLQNCAQDRRQMLRAAIVVRKLFKSISCILLASSHGGPAAGKLCLLTNWKAFMRTACNTAGLCTVAGACQCRPEAPTMRP